MMAEGGADKDITGPLPSAQNLEWANELTSHAWSYINGAVVHYVETVLLDELRKQMSTLGELVEIHTLHIGTEPLKLNGVSVQPNPYKLKRISIDCDFSYEGKPVVDGSFGIIPFGVDNVKFAGRLRVIIGPLLNQLPVLGAISFFFVHEPTFDFNLSGVLQIGDFWIIRGAVDDVIKRLVRDNVMLPNRQVCILDRSGAVDENLVRYPLPQGVVFLTVVKISNVEDKDWIGGGSDVFVKLRVGADEFQTSTKDDVKTTTVAFNERFDITMDEIADQILHIDVFDKDNLLSDDTLGNITVNLSAIEKDVDVDVTLADTKRKSDITLFVQAMDLSPWHPIVSPKTDRSGETLPTHMLVVRLGKAYDLPTADGGGAIKYGANVYLSSLDVETRSLSMMTADDGTICHMASESERQCRFSLLTLEEEITVSVLKDVPGTVAANVGEYKLTFESLRMQDGMAVSGEFTLDSGVVMGLHFQLFGIVPCQV